MAETGAGTRSAGTDDDDLSDLRRQVAEAKRKTEAAEEARKAERQGRMRAEGQTQAERTARFADNEVAVDNNIVAHEQLLASLEQDLAGAMGEGDAAKIAKATRNIATVQTRLDQARSQKHQLENIRRQGGPAPLQVTDPGDDPKLAPYPPATRAWIKKNPRFLNDDSFRTKAIGYHNIAVADGLEVDSPEYFAFIENGMGIRPSQDRKSTTGGGDVDFSEVEDKDFDAEDSPLSGASQAREPDSNTTGRTNRRSANSGSEGDGRRTNDEVRLSPAETEAASFSYPDEWAKDPNVAKKKYAEFKRELKRDGKIGVGH